MLSGSTDKAWFKHCRSKYSAKHVGRTSRDVAEGLDELVTRAGPFLVVNQLPEIPRRHRVFAASRRLSNRVHLLYNSLVGFVTRGVWMFVGIPTMVAHAITGINLIGIPGEPDRRREESISKQVANVNDRASTGQARRVEGKCRPCAVNAALSALSRSLVRRDRTARSRQNFSRDTGRSTNASGGSLIQVPANRSI